ncbi:hypothetical protein [Sunxiuqinia indica]|uniref:hypothetical protein n=1 Tax=Sunxiuqinia indica TaxID=2692584 RepID=UPI00135BE2DE|nr:hypothetical protein [Sunxiuqinia indica]
MDLKDLKITTDSKCSELNWVLNEKDGEPNFSGEIFRILVEKHNALIEALEKGSIEAPAALPLQNVSISFLSEGLKNKILKRIGLLAEKQGSISGLYSIYDGNASVKNLLKEIADDYGRQVDFLKSVLANEC